MPNHTPSRSQLINVLEKYSTEKYEVAVEGSTLLTQEYPNHAFGWKILVGSLLYLGKIDESIKVAEKMIEIAPNDPEARNLQGDSYGAAGSLRKAISSYIAAIKLKPDFLQAYCNMGAIFQRLGELENAEKSYRKALEINSDSVEALNNLGNILVEMGDLQKAEMIFKKATGVAPINVEALLNYSALMISMNKLLHAKECLRRIITSDREKYGLPALVDLAILTFLDGNHQVSESLLIDSSKINNDDLRFKNEIIYWKYLQRILQWHKNNPRVMDSSQTFMCIYSLGESHALTNNGVLVEQFNEHYMLKALWVRGCKQWHFASQGSNKYKEALKGLVISLPRKSIIVVSIGEIDCRINDGIIPYIKKNPQVSMGKASSSTIIGYLNYLFEINQPLGHNLIISGIPAPNIDFSLASPEDTNFLISLIRQFNAVLKQESIKFGFGFLDAYELTNDGSGKSNKEWHIDDYHLKPSAIQQLFSNHYSSGSSI